MAAAYVQALAKNEGTTISSKSSATTDWTSNLTAGNSVYVTVHTWSNPSVTHNTVTVGGVSATKDEEGAETTGTNNLRVSVWRVDGVAGGNKPVIAVTLSGSATLVFGAVEASGCTGAPDAHNNNSSTSGSTTPTTGAVTTTLASTLS